MSAQAVWLKRGGRKETESRLFDAKGVAIMLNEDGTVCVEMFNPGGNNSLLIRISPDDVKSQVHILKRWAALRG